MEELQAGLAVGQQHRQGSGVRVLADAQVLTGLRAQRIVVEPQEAGVAGPETAGQVVRRHAQVAADAGEYARGHPLRRAIERFHHRPERRQAGRPLGHAACHRAMLRHGPEIENLLPVPHVLGQFPVEEAPGIIPRALDGEFFVARQGEEAPHLAQGGIDQRGVDAVPDDLETAPLGTGAIQRPVPVVAGELRNIQHGQSRHHCYSPPRPGPIHGGGNSSRTLDIFARSLPQCLFWLLSTPISSAVRRRQHRQ